MAEKFDLSSLIKDVSKLGTDREQIEYILYPCLVPDAANGYSMDGVAELARSIELVGLQQPLRVRPIKEAPGTYRIISGHRRHAAIGLLLDQGLDRFDEGVPCIVDSSEASSALRELQLILGNADNREKTPADQLRDINGTADCLRRLEAEGYRFPGRHREWISQMIGLSKSKIGRLQAIGKNLDPTLLERFNAGRLGETVAYRISQEDAAVQAELAEKLGPAVEALTLDSAEKVIGQIKKPERNKKPEADAPIEDRVKDYLEKRAEEDAEFRERLLIAGSRLFEALEGVCNRQDGIDMLKAAFGSRKGWVEGYVYADCTPTGLYLRKRISMNKFSSLHRRWADVYDMLCAIALNHAANGGSFDEDEDDEPEEDLPTVRWEGRSVTPPINELLLLRICRAGITYTAAKYKGGTRFVDPIMGRELDDIASNMSMWLRLPDPTAYGEEYRVAPPAVPTMDTAPEWQTGTPKRPGFYATWAVWEVGKNWGPDFEILFWDGTIWKETDDPKAELEADFDVLQWYALPEKPGPEIEEDET